MLDKKELQQIALNHSADINLENFIKIIKNILHNHIPFWLMIQLYYQIIL